MTDLQLQVAAVTHHQMDSPLYLNQHQRLLLHLVAFDVLSKEHGRHKINVNLEALDPDIKTPHNVHTVDI